MSLPWERFGTPRQVDTIPEPVPEVIETVEPQQIPTAPDLAEVMREMIDEAQRAAREQATSYAKDTIGAVLRGQEVNHSRPTIIRRTKEGREIVVADAKNRSWRTLLQGLAIDVFAAVATLLATISHIDPFVKESWAIVGALVMKSVAQAVMSYFMRLRVKPTITERGVKMATLPMPEALVRNGFLGREEVSSAG